MIVEHGKRSSKCDNYTHKKCNGVRHVRVGKWKGFQKCECECHG